MMMMTMNPCTTMNSTNNNMTGKRRRRTSTNMTTTAATAAVAVATVLTLSSSSMLAVVDAFSTTTTPTTSTANTVPSFGLGFGGWRRNGEKIDRRMRSSALYMTTTTATPFFGDSFFEDNNSGGGGNGGTNSNNNDIQNDGSNNPSSSSTDEVSNSKFVTGDALHRLRHKVLAMRLELQEARREHDRLVDAAALETSSSATNDNTNNSKELLSLKILESKNHVHQLEQTIMKTQQVDAEFVYTVSLERKALAIQNGLPSDEIDQWHDRAMEARAALPQFQLEGLWVGKYGDDDESDYDDDDYELDYYPSSSTTSSSSRSMGYELINVTYVGDVLTATKVTTGGKNVPRGAETFTVDLSPSAMKSSSSSSQHQQPDVLSPIELGDDAARQWGCKYLQRFAGQGQVAAENFEDSQWIDGQLILVNQYFSFAWLPIGHQVFFGRPTPELVLKLMREEEDRESGVHGCETRAFLERCWDETEHLEDDRDVTHDGIVVTPTPLVPPSTAASTTTTNFYHEDGCFE